MGRSDQKLQKTLLTLLTLFRDAGGLNTLAFLTRVKEVDVGCGWLSGGHLHSDWLPLLRIIAH